MSRRSRSQGFTLVELMVSVVLGLFIVAVLAAMFMGSKMTFNSQNGLAHIQENGRFAMDQIGADLRMAGFRGCMGQRKGTPVSNILNSSTSALYNFGVSVGASHYASGWSPAVDAAFTSLTPAPNNAGDVLTVRRTTGAGWSLTSEMSSATANLAITAPKPSPAPTGWKVPDFPFGAGDLLLLSDCSGAVVFQASAATEWDAAGAGGAIAHATGTGRTPDVSTASLGRAFLQDAVLYRLQSVTYYLAPSQRPGKTGVMALWSYTNPVYDGTTQPQELVTGVEKFVVTAGVDTDGDQSADKYVAPGSVADWSTVVALKVDMVLVSSADKLATAPQPYQLGGVTITPTDRKLRTVMSLTTSLRNSVI